MRAHIEARGTPYQIDADSVYGGFELFGIPPGRYKLRARWLGYRAVERTVEMKAGYCTTLVLRLAWSPSDNRITID